MPKKIPLLPVPEGTKVRIEHYFNGDTAYYKRFDASTPPKYVTEASLIDLKSGDVLAFAASYCSPRDNPSRKLGRAIAHNRVIKLYTEATK